MTNYRMANPFPLILFTATWACFVCASDSFGAPTREQVVGWLNQQAQLVRSMECRFTVRGLKTTAANAELISKLAETRGDASLRGRYIFSDEDARVRSYGAHWWRKEEKERKEVSKLDPRESGAVDSAPFVIETFDGALVRNLTTNGDGVAGTINNAATAGYGNMNRFQPWSLLFEYQATPYWELLKQSPEFKVLESGQPGTAVMFRHPMFEKVRFLLRFDREQRLIQRDVIARMEDDRPPRLNERHELAGYEPLTDASGERHWFPKRATWRYYMAGALEHPEIETRAQVMEIASITVNPDIPDSMFEVHFPENVKVVDWSRGQPQELNPTREIPRFSAEDRSWLPAAGAIALALALSAACFVYARRRGPGDRNRKE
jgi:hypothetical protein